MAKRATLEILQDGEQVLGSNTAGKYFVQEYVDDQPTGGQFFSSIEDAERHMRAFELKESPQFLRESAMLNDPFDGIRYPEDEEPNPYSGTYSED